MSAGRPRAGRRGAACHQPHGQAAGLGRAAVQDRQQRGHAAFADLLGGQLHGGELRFDGRGQGQIVETGDGEVVGDPEPEPAGGLAGARGEDVVVADEGGGPGAGGGQHPLRGRATRGDVERRRDGP